MTFPAEDSTGDGRRALAGQASSTFSGVGGAAPQREQGGKRAVPSTADTAEANVSQPLAPDRLTQRGSYGGDVEAEPGGAVELSPRSSATALMPTRSRYAVRRAFLAAIVSANAFTLRVFGASERIRSDVRRQFAAHAADRIPSPPQKLLRIVTTPRANLTGQGRNS